MESSKERKKEYMCKYDIYYIENVEYIITHT